MAVLQRQRKLEQELQEANARLESLVQDKVALIKEIHHRVKNNLQVITSLLRLEAGRSDHAPTQTVLGQMQERIRSMALLHELIYRAGSFASIDLGSYVSEVATQAFRSLHGSSSSVVRLRLDLGSVQVGLDQATPCGLLLTELLSNALKHGFADGRSGEVLVELQPVAGGLPDRWCLRVSDTGVGLPADYAARQQGSLGLQLASNLATQLGGSLVVGPAPAPAEGAATAPGAASAGASFAVTFVVLAPVPPAPPAIGP